MRRVEASTAGDGLTLREAFTLALRDLADERPDVLFLDADNATPTTELVFSAAHPDRFLQMGVAEQNMVGVAAGLATMGYVPYLTSYACFQVFRAHDQVRVAVAQTGLPVRLVGQSAGILTGLTGKTHQSIDDVAVMRAMPGMTVVAPADEHETRAIVRWSVDYPGPVYIRLARGTSPLIFGPGHLFSCGEAIAIHDGGDLAILSTGLQTARVLATLPRLATRGIHPLVIHVPTIKPLDEEAIAEAAELTGRVVTVEDHSIIGGLGGGVCEVLAARRPTPVLRLGIADTYAESGPHGDLVEKYGISPSAVATAIEAWMRTTS